MKKLVPFSEPFSSITTSVMSSVDKRGDRFSQVPPPSRGDPRMSRVPPPCPPCEDKPLDANRYATKKTIAQGMLDIALLTANASQLKYVLTIGAQHQFYTLMVALITVSIILQTLTAIISIVLGSAFNINKQSDQKSANVWNNVALTFNIVTVAVNVVISGFDMRDTNSIVVPTSTNVTFNDTLLGRLFSG